MVRCRSSENSIDLDVPVLDQVDPELAVLDEERLELLERHRQGTTVDSLGAGYATRMRGRLLAAVTRAPATFHKQ